MLESFRAKIAFSGIAVLGIGLTLLIITFASAFVFLSDGLQILSTQNLAQTFGDSLAPLIATSVRVMYLGVMGWIGSLITIRGITLIANAPKPETLEAPKAEATRQKTQVQSQPKSQKQETPKPAQPEMLVIPLEEAEIQQTTKPKSK